MSSTTIKPEPKELFDVLNNEVSWLHTVWELFIQLYGSGDENYELMNASAPQFFALLKIILFDELVLIFNRLTDQATIHGNTNACLELLIEQIDQKLYSELVSLLSRRLENIRDTYSAFRTWRNKKISHKDLSTALHDDSDTLPGIPRRQAEAAIKEIANFMNDFSIAMLGGSQTYIPFLAAHGDGIALMQWIKQTYNADEK